MKIKILKSKKGIGKATIELTRKEAEQVSHAIVCNEKCAFEQVRDAGKKQLRELDETFISKLWGIGK